MKKNRSVIFAAVTLSLTAVMLLMIYAPLELYAGNVDGFTYDIIDLLRIMLPAAFCVAAVSSVIFSIIGCISEKLFHVILVIGMTCLISVYLIGTFFSANLPPLDGTEVNWNVYDYQRIYSVLIFAVCTSVFVILANKFGISKFRKRMSVTCVLISGMLFISGAILLFNEDTLREKDDLSTTYDHIMDMSSKQNFIMVLLDSISADAFQTALKTDSVYETVFRDFTFFRNTVGAYPFTEQTVPFLFTGDWYENDESYFVYKENAYRDSQLFKSLEENGFKMGMFEESVPTSRGCMDKFVNTVAIDTDRFLLPVEFIKTQIKLIGLKYAPYDLKRFCLISPDYIYANTQKDFTASTYYSWENADFYNKLCEENFNISEDKQFKFIHLRGGHQPFFYDKDMNIVPDGTSYEECVLASLKLSEKFIDKMKSADIYDNSIIIILADHGYYKEDRMNPVLLIKGIGEDHALSISDIPVSFEDLQEAYKNLLDEKTADEVFSLSENENRQRRFLDYLYNDEDHMKEVIQTGFANDTTTMIPSGVEYNRSDVHIKLYSVS